MDFSRRSTCHRINSLKRYRINSLKRQLHTLTDQTANFLMEIPEADTSSNKMSSLFNCKLSSQRSESLINGYCKLSISIHVTVDIRKIIASYFNHLMYHPNILTSSETIEYMVNNTIQFNIESTPNSNIAISLKSASKITSLIRLCIYRVRVYFISTQTDDIQISKEYLFKTMPNIRHGDVVHFSDAHADNYDLCSIEIEVLYLRWQKNRTWSKWPYPWNDNEQDVKLLMNDYNWFWRGFNQHCFGVNGKYCVDLHPKAHALDYLKCKALSNCQDIWIMESELLSQPRLGPLMPFISQIEERNNVILAEFAEMKITKNMVREDSELRDAYTGLNDLCKYIGGKYRSFTYSIDWMKQRDVNRQNIYRKTVWRFEKNTKTYRNNKKKYQYNRW